MVMSLEEAVPGLWPSEAATRSMKEGFGGGIGSKIVSRGCGRRRSGGVP
jgi:hypothetical protein